MTDWRHPNQRDPAELPVELRRVAVPPQVRKWIGLRAGAPVIDVRRLPGASSTAVHAVRLADQRTLVLRRYVWTKFREEEPEAPGREVDALNYARRHRLPVPRVVAADPSGNDVGDGVPALLMTRVPGRALASPDVQILAATVAAVHAVNSDGFDHGYFPWCRGTSTSPPRGCQRPTDWARALELWRSCEPAYEPRFVHRDFHPGNVLWSRGEISGVVDWANACNGPAGIDVATCRWNLHNWAGGQVADRFVRAYEQASGHAHHAYWDVASILEDDWDTIDDAARVHQAEERLALALPRLLASI